MSGYEIVWFKSGFDKLVQLLELLLPCLNNLFNFPQLINNIFLSLQHWERDFNFKKIRFGKAWYCHCLIQPFKVKVSAKIIQISGKQYFAFGGQAKSGLNIPERFFNENGVIYTSFSPNNHSIRFANVTISITHNSTAAVDWILSIRVFDSPLVSTIYYYKYIVKSHPLIPTNPNYSCSSSSSNLLMSSPISFSSLRSSAIISPVGGYSTDLYSVFLYLLMDRS